MLSLLCESLFYPIHLIANSSVFITNRSHLYYTLHGFYAHFLRCYLIITIAFSLHFPSPCGLFEASIFILASCFRVPYSLYSHHVLFLVITILLRPYEFFFFKCTNQICNFFCCMLHIYTIRLLLDPLPSSPPHIRTRQIT